MRLAAVGLVLLIAGAGAAQAEKYERRVDVDGSAYRVSVKDGVVTVAKKSFVVGFTIAERDKMRAAVTKATGCQVVDEFPNGARLKGKLDCSARTAEPSTP